MGWVYVFLAGFSELGFAWPLKAGAGLNKPGLLLLSIACIGLSVFLLGLAFETLPTSSAYPVWVGLGTIGTTLVGAAFYGELPSRRQLLFVALLLAGIAGLTVTGS